MCSASTADLIACGAWALWTGRNNRRHGRKVWEPGVAARFIATLLEELAGLKAMTQLARPRRMTGWKRPDLGWVKVNSDAGFCSGDCTGIAGVVIRDHDGLVLAAAARWLDDVPDALTAEALAAKEGRELAAELGYQRVILESDCQSLRSLLRDPSSRRSVIGGPCFDITELGRELDEFRVEWVCRGAKSVAPPLLCVQLELLLLIAFLSGLSLYQSGCVILQCVILQRKIVILLVINEKLCSPKKKIHRCKA